MEGDRRWPGWIGTAAAVLLGLVLLVAAAAKAIDPFAFVRQVQGEGLAAVAPAWLVAAAALAIETGLGLALIVGIRRRGVLIPAGFLIVFFLFLNGRAWWRAAHGLVDPTAGCGCFGNLVDRTPAEAFWQDALLLVPAWSLSWLGRLRGPLGRVRAWTPLVGVVAVLLFAWRAPELPLDDLATRLRPGVELAGICAGEERQRTCLVDVAPALAEGRDLVIVTSLDTPAFTAAVPRLNEWMLAGGDPVTVVAAADPDAVQQFYWEWGPAFEIIQAPESLLAPLYRRLPRSFLAQDGEVEATWDGLPPPLQGYDASDGRGPSVGEPGGTIAR